MRGGRLIILAGAAMLGMIAPAAAQPVAPPPPAPFEGGPDAMARDAAEQARRAQELGAAAAAATAQAVAAEQRAKELQTALKKSESDAEEARLRLESLVKRAYEAEERLIARRAQHAAAFGAMIALSKTPAPAAVVYAERPADAALAASAIKGLDAALTEDVLGMQKMLDELAHLRSDAESARREALARIEAVRPEEAALRKVLGERRLEGEAAAQESERLRKEAAEQARIAAQMQNALRNVPAPAANPRRLPPAAAPAAGGTALAYAEPPPAPIEARPPPRLYERRPFVWGRDRMRAPVSGARVATRFNELAPHGEGVSPGVFLEAPAGANVYAPWGGVIEKIAMLRNSGGALMVVRIDEDTLVSFFGLNEMMRKEGDEVAAGEVLGRLEPPGEQRRSTSLFIQIRRNDQPVDPLPLMDGLNER